MSEKRFSWRALAKSALQDIAIMAELVCTVCLVHILWALYMLAFGDVSIWVFLIPASFFVAALIVGIGLFWDKASKGLLARLESHWPGMEGQRSRPVLRFFLSSRIPRNFASILLAVSLVIVLAPGFELAIRDALIGLSMLFAIGVLLAPATRAVLRWAGVQPSKEGSQS